MIGKSQDQIYSKKTLATKSTMEETNQGISQKTGEDN